MVQFESYEIVFACLHFYDTVQINQMKARPLYGGVAQSGMYTIREAAELLGIDLSKATVAVQGYGNAGAIAAQLYAEQGAVIIAASDSRGGIFCAEGFDPTLVAQDIDAIVLARAGVFRLDTTRKSNSRSQIFSLPIGMPLLRSSPSEVRETPPGTSTRD